VDGAKELPLYTQLRVAPGVVQYEEPQQFGGPAGTLESDEDADDTDELLTGVDVSIMEVKSIDFSPTPAFVPPSADDEAFTLFETTLETEEDDAGTTCLSGTEDMAPIGSMSLADDDATDVTVISASREGSADGRSHCKRRYGGTPVIVGRMDVSPSDGGSIRNCAWKEAYVPYAMTALMSTATNEAAVVV
jgi:hypothetical protein